MVGATRHLGVIDVKKEELIDHLAGLIQGCEVPRSMRMIGTAEAHFDAIHSGLNLFGYHPGDVGRKEITEILKKALGENP